MSELRLEPKPNLVGAVVRMRCDQHRGMLDRCSGAVARLFMPDWVSITVCKVSLDFWLDLADDEPEFEPVELRWISH